MYRQRQEQQNSEIIDPTPQIAPKKHKAAGLWQSGVWRCKDR
ncbi:hypothetical protein [Nitrosomonas sp. Nm34]|nr:hypothetical protein [Nitrosomonas sp. Nm34]